MYVNIYGLDSRIQEESWKEKKCTSQITNHAYIKTEQQFMVMFFFVYVFCFGLVFYLSAKSIEYILNSELKTATKRESKCYFVPLSLHFFVSWPCLSQAGKIRLSNSGCSALSHFSKLSNKAMQKPLKY